MKKKILGLAALASAAAANAAPAWATGKASGDSVSSAFDEVMTYAAPIGIGVVVAVGWHSVLSSSLLTVVLVSS